MKKRWQSTQQRQWDVTTVELILPFKNEVENLRVEVNTSPGSKNVEEALRKNIVGEFIDEILDKENWQYPPTTRRDR